MILILPFNAANWINVHNGMQIPDLTMKFVLNTPKYTTQINESLLVSTETDTTYTKISFVFHE